MKYTFKFFIAIVFGYIAMFASCEGKDGDSTAVLDKSSIEVSSSGGMTLISVNFAQSWNVGVDADWVDLSPISGNGAGTVTVKIDSCVGARRTSEIIFVSGSTVKTVSVLQKGNQKDDHYKTGDIIKIHRHTTGNGVSIVIIGDGFDREDCRVGGMYEENCRKLAKLFLQMPVIRDYQDYFDIFARVDISRERGVRNCVADIEAGHREKCADNAYKSGHDDLDWDKIRRNGTLTAGKDDRSIIFMGNGMIGGAAYGDIAVYSANEPDKPYWMMHEFTGHIVGGLPDQYYVTGDVLATDGTRKAIDSWLTAGPGNGEQLVFDYRKDPNTVFWKDFINKDGYTNVGVYPGAYWDLKLGELTVCEDYNTSVMNGPVNHYTVMERLQIWRRIQHRAGFTTITIPEFKEYDRSNQMDVDWTWDRYENWHDDRVPN